MKFLFLLITYLFSSPIFADSLQQNGIEVIGKASVETKPDTFIFTVSISQRGWIASKTKAVVDKKSQLVVDKYLSLGINQNSIESSRLTLTPRYQQKSKVSEFEMHQRSNNQAVNREDKNGKVVINSNGTTNNAMDEQQKIYFDVSRSITITFTDFKLYDQLLDQVVSIGVTHISPLQTMIINNEAFYQQALIKAVDNATHKAERIAQRIGLTLGKIKQLKESPYSAPQAYMMASGSRDSFNSQTTNNHVSAQVSVIFALKKDN